MASGAEVESLSSEDLLEWAQKDKRRFLHAVYRVGDLDRTIKSVLSKFDRQIFYDILL